MFRVTWALLLAMALPAVAHVGMENETAVTWTPRSLRVVTRCAPELAWKLLGPKAPRGPLEQAFAAARPDLEALAATLVNLRDGDGAIEATRVRVDLEPDFHVAFALTFPLRDGALMLEAPFLARLDGLEVAEVRFLDHSTLPRPDAPYAAFELQQADQSIRFDRQGARLLRP